MGFLDCTKSWIRCRNRGLPLGLPITPVGWSVSEVVSVFEIVLVLE